MSMIPDPEAVASPGEQRAPLNFLTIGSDRVWCVRCHGWKQTEGEDDPCPDDTPDGACPIQQGDEAKWQPITADEAQQAIEALGEELRDLDDSVSERLRSLESEIATARTLVQTLESERDTPGDGDDVKRAWEEVISRLKTLVVTDSYQEREACWTGVLGAIHGQNATRNRVYSARWFAKRDELESALATAQREREEARAALERFGHHRSKCYITGDCTCGLDAALRSSAYDMNARQPDDIVRASLVARRGERVEAVEDMARRVREAEGYPLSGLEAETPTDDDCDLCGQPWKSTGCCYWSRGTPPDEPSVDRAILAEAATLIESLPDRVSSVASTREMAAAIRRARGQPGFEGRTPDAWAVVRDDDLIIRSWNEEETARDDALVCNHNSLRSRFTVEPLFRRAPVSEPATTSPGLCEEQRPEPPCVKCTFVRVNRRGCKGRWTKKDAEMMAELVKAVHAQYPTAVSIRPAELSDPRHPETIVPARHPGDPTGENA